MATDRREVSTGRPVDGTGLPSLPWGGSPREGPGTRPAASDGGKWAGASMHAASGVRGSGATGKRFRNPAFRLLRTARPGTGRAGAQPPSRAQHPGRNTAEPGHERANRFGSDRL